MEEKKLVIGMLGLGTVGRGIPLLLKKHDKKIKNVSGMTIDLKKVFVRNQVEKEEFAKEYDLSLTENISNVLTDPTIDVVIEVMGGIEPAKSYIIEALSRGKHVVTANKDLIALHGKELVQIAKDNHCNLYYEASVAGGIPILRTIADSLMADDIEKLYGIVNGTTNYMLTQMTTHGLTYKEALLNAQQLGFAEADPTNDVEGIDAAYKMMILTQFSFGMTIDLSDVSLQGLSTVTMADINMANKLGYQIKMIGTSERTSTGVAVDVAPTLVANSHPLSSVHNEMNAVFIKSYGLGESMYYGPGAGSNPTATSVISDLMTIATNTQLGISGNQFNTFETQTRLSDDTQRFSKFYLSIRVPDQPGVFNQLASIMSENDVSLEQIIQDKQVDGFAHVTLITHETSQAQCHRILKKITDSDGFELVAYFKVLE